jgi:hypothetical protein
MFNARPRSLWSKSGVRLALFAMALQLVLSFAHIHLAPPAPGLGNQATGQSSQSNDEAPKAADECLICANIAAFAATDLPPPVISLQPIGHGEIIALTPTLALLAPESFRLFRSRAPPYA